MKYFTYLLVTNQYHIIDSFYECKEKYEHLTREELHVRSAILPTDIPDNAAHDV